MKSLEELTRRPYCPYCARTERRLAELEAQVNGYRSAVFDRDARLADAERLIREIAQHDEWSPWQEPCRAFFRTAGSAKAAHQYFCTRCGTKRGGLLDHAAGIGGYSWACPECGSHDVSSRIVESQP